MSDVSEPHAVSADGRTVLLEAPLGTPLEPGGFAVVATEPPLLAQVTATTIAVRERDGRRSAVLEGRATAKTLGISGPQWMILMALSDMDKGDGVPVNVVSKKLHVDSSFVTTQSKLLEKKGFLRRKTSTEDARIVQMSLTDKTYKHLAAPGVAAGNVERVHLRGTRQWRA